MPWLILRLPTQNTLFCHCYGGPGCTLARSSSNDGELTASSPPTNSAGPGQKQANGSEQTSRLVRLELSSDAELQDLYLLVSALFKGGFDVSVSVQATPASARSLLDIAGQYTSWTQDFQLIELLHYSAVVTKFWSDIMRR